LRVPSTPLGSDSKQGVDARHKAGHDESSFMLRKIITAVIVVPLVVLIVAFAVANRQTVTVSFDPFSQVSPAYAATLPLFAVIFAVLVLGVLVGGFAAWLRQGKWRRLARRADADVRALHDELGTIRRRFGTSDEPAPPPERPIPLPVIPPPIP
jgi:uncharacterized integral membrane protein